MVMGRLEMAWMLQDVAVWLQGAWELPLDGNDEQEGELEGETPPLDPPSPL